MQDLPKGLASSYAGRIARKLGEISAGRVLDTGTGSGGFISTLQLRS